MPLSEKVRIEIFIPDLISGDLLDELAGELTYAFGGCTIVSASGRYRSLEADILSDRISIVFSDVPLSWERDRLALAQYVDRLRRAVHQALESEEAALVCAYSVSHAE